MQSSVTFRAVVLASVLSLCSTSPSQAGLIPIQEEFVLVQSTFVDASLDAVLLFLLEKNGVLDDNAVITYQSAFTISLDATGTPSGTFAAIYGGLYNGLPVTGTDTGTLTTSGTDLVFTGPSKIKIDDKEFANNLKFTEKDNNKGSLEGDVTDDSGKKKTISGPDLTKEKANGTLKLTGNVNIDGHNETITFTLDQKTGKFDSTIKSFPLIKKKDSGDFGPLKDPLVGGSQDYQMNLTFQSEPIPEPSAIVISSILLGMFGLDGLRRRTKKKHPPQSEPRLQS